jgi:AcrR family transcriptional regulator
MSSEAKDLTKTQRQILDAAISCVTQWGIERVTLNDIAYEARVARSTVYSYYKTRDDVIRAALMSSAKSFGEKLFEHICQFDTAAERTLEAVLYSLQKFPDEPALSLLSDNALTGMVREHSLTAGGGMDMGSALFQVILQDDSYAQEELEEISEFSIRFMLSLLTMHSPRERSEEELRGFIARRLLPSIGLSVPLQYQRLRSTV